MFAKSARILCCISGVISAKNDGAEPEQRAGTGIVRSNGETMGAEVCSLAHFFRWLASAAPVPYLPLQMSQM